MNYRKAARDDAHEFIERFSEQIELQMIEDSRVSEDFRNDWEGGDSYLHESYVDREYDLGEAAGLLYQLDEFEETDSGLWEGQSPREAISTRAAFTYGRAVEEYVREFVKEINDKLDELVEDAEITGEIASGIIGQVLA